MRERYLTTEEVAQRYGLTPQTVRRLATERKIPRAMLIGRKLLWLKEVLDKFDAEQAGAEVSK